jgi:hypothetical protein
MLPTSGSKHVIENKTYQMLKSCADGIVSISKYRNLLFKTPYRYTGINS